MYHDVSRSVVSLMIRMLDPREGETIYDPACGTGGMLLESVHHVHASGGNAKTLWGKLATIPACPQGRDTTV
ncbi:MAG: hypothetical protein NVS4B1_22700 [Ktedonobacteraceae bacterium]